jgi:DNA sulfur modification protein DndC
MCIGFWLGIMGYNRKIHFFQTKDIVQAIYSKLVEEIRIEYLSTEQDYPWIIGFSGGKDSTLVAQSVFAAMMDISPSRLTRKVHVVANDTLVESPLVVAHLHQSLREIEEGAHIHDLPMTVATTTPEATQTFWVLLIGKGYPSPNQQMRWCTDRLKIQPTSRYIREKVAENGAAIILLGVRRDESEVRRRRIDAYENTPNSRLHPHNDLSGAFIFRPIVDLTTDEVWETLATYPPLWGGDNSRLIKLYRDAAGGECPIVLSQEDAPGCGTNSSRFGCWTCTVVEKDKSLQGFVDSGKVQYAPLIEFRDWLRSIRNDLSFRQGRRRSGKITVANGRLVPGPFTVAARQMILERLRETEAAYGDRLISDMEIETIQRIWAEDLIQQNQKENFFD